MNEATEVYPRLWQGSAPAGRVKGADLVVLTAKEYQPSAGEILAPAILRAPLDDGVLSPEEKRTALAAAHEVVKALRKGRTVLVTCAQGRNRSGLVVALALVSTGRVRRDEAVRLVRRARGPSALSNDSFLRFLAQVAP